MTTEHVFTGCDYYSDEFSHDCRWLYDADLDSWCLYCLADEVTSLREALVSCEGYAIANGADLPFVAMYVNDTPQAAVIERAGTYPRDARREHPGPLALNRPADLPDDRKPDEHGRLRELRKDRPVAPLR